MPHDIAITRSNDLRPRRIWRSREEIEIEKRRESLLLSRDRLVREIGASASLALRIARERALEHVEHELAALRSTFSRGHEA